MTHHNRSMDEDLEAMQMICPKCNHRMQKWTSHGVQLDHCNACKGLWFDSGELERHFANLGIPLSEEDLAVNRKTHVTCPSCREGPMIEALLDEVPVDACPGCHGIFLDLGEVHELMGSLNRAHRPATSKTRGFDNFTLGLFVGANLGRRPV